jgi:hypothetical protein
MFRRLSVAVAAVALCSGSALAADVGRVHFANVTGADVQLLIDDGAGRTVAKGSWVYDPAPAGNHRIRVRFSDGKTLDQSWAFKTEDLAVSGSHKYWCLAVVGNGSSDPYFLMKLTGEQCGQVLSAGNPID